MSKSNLSFHVSGMHCASCAANIQRKLSKSEGVSEIAVNYANEQATVEYDEKKISTQKIEKVISGLGYIAHIDEDEGDDIAQKNREIELTSLKSKLTISIFLTVILMASMIPGVPKIFHDKWLMLILSTPIQFWVGNRFYKGALAAAKNKTTNMDTLVVLGTSVAYFYSLFVVLFGQVLESYKIPTHVYFEASSSIITLVLLGKYLEIRAKGQASSAIKKLLSLQAKTAHLVHGSKIIITPIEKILVGDILLVKPGEKIPLDGVIVEGQSNIDESMVTGESIPVGKGVKDSVIGSTINSSQAFKMKVEKVGDQTILSQIIQMVKRAQGSKPPIQKLVDTISSYFVPVVIILSIITFGIWFMFGPEPKLLSAMISMISVLIVACPCALGLATPTSLMVGVGRGASMGILIKDAQALEIANKVSIMIFDKTGTLTQGKPKVQNLLFSKEVDKNEIKEVKEIIGSIESRSHHPLAQAIVTHLESEKNINLTKKVSNFQDISGKGIVANVGRKKIQIGSLTWIKSLDIHIDSNTQKKIESWTHQAQSISIVVIGGKFMAVIGIADQIKSKSAAVIDQLKSMNIKPVMLTGDNKGTAKSVADELGIGEYRAEVLPQDKEDIVKQYVKDGEVVAMLGDGINDAPALAAAHMGIAMGSGTDVAMESAGITLVRGDISLATSAIRLSKATMKNIRQNLFWAFGYNVVLIPVAMGALYPFFGVQINPIMAGAAMAFSSVSVVSNALRLKRISI